MATVIYARQSLDRRGEAAAVNRQLDECRALASNHGLAVDQEIVDNDVSATTGVRRPGFEKLLRLIEHDAVDTVVVWHTDRLYRRLKDLVTIVDVARDKPLKVLAVKAGDLDLNTPSGRMVASLLGSVASYETEQKGARQVAANIQRAKQGHWQFSNRPYGYERVDGKVQLVEPEAEIIREAFARYLAGETYYAIVQDLNVRQVPTLKGGPWTMTQLRDRLKNPAYAALRAYKGEIVAEGDWPAIIDVETWERYQAARQARAKRHDWPNRTKYLLSGLAVCGVCGGRMLARPYYQGKKDDPKRKITMTYQCTTGWCVSRGLDRLDTIVEDAILDRLTQSDTVALFPSAPDLQPLVVESQQLRDRRDDLAALLVDGTLTAAAVREQSAKIQRRLEKLHQQINAAESGNAATSLILSDDVAHHWRTALTLQQKRAIISALLTVTVFKQPSRVFDPSKVQITWHNA